MKGEGLETEALRPLPFDCSRRRYFRLPKALLMDAPPPYESTTQFQHLGQILEETGLSVPRIYAADHKHGFLLIEDFGELPYRKAIQQGISEKLLYGETIRALIHLHQHCHPELVSGSHAILSTGSRSKFGMTSKNEEPSQGLPTYTQDFFIKKASLFLEWNDVSFSEKAKEEFKHLWEEAFRHQPHLPYTLTLRDVMVDNLLWLPQRQGWQRCGFIDFQDGSWGPITYDLVSLLEDARRDISPVFAQEMLEIYFEAFPDLLRDDFWASYSLWGAQRTTRILGVFFRQAKREGNRQYLVHIPRLKKILARDLQHPSLKGLRAWFQMYGDLA